ncbi:MAG: hypothetical protein EXR07_12585 [Acetobacteraceae bacterium]|nr:hypothetical protein [Acetobacteraceae bacterium]
MTMAPIGDRSSPDSEIDREADAMKDQLRKDVASWRAQETGDPSGRFTAPAVKPAAAPVKRAARPKAPPVAAEPVPAVKKPFKMSYDGTTDRDYIAHRINLGAR